MEGKKEEAVGMAILTSSPAPASTSSSGEASSPLASPPHNNGGASAANNSGAEADVPGGLKPNRLEEKFNKVWGGLSRKTRKAIIAIIVAIILMLVILTASLMTTGYVVSNQTVVIKNPILLRGGWVVNTEGIVGIRDVLIGNGAILIVSAANGLIPVSMLPAGTQTINCSGKYVMPGGIEAHTHLAMPFMGTVAIDGWEAGSQAAVAGGTTTVLDFVMASKNYGSSIVNSLDQWQKNAASGKTLVNYGFHMALGWWDDSVAKDMATVVKRGVPSFKHFMAYKGSLMLTDAEILASFKRCKELGILPSVHAEDGETIATNQQRLAVTLGQGAFPLAHAQSRPPQVEGDAVARVIALAKQAETPVVIVHTSAAQSIGPMQRAQSSGQKVYGEVLAVHLTLDETRYFLNRTDANGNRMDPETAWNTAAAHVLSPPLREKSHVAAMWAALLNGTLTMVSTDHCAFSTAQKRAGRTDFRLIPNGIPGLEERLYLLWDQGVNTGKISVQQFVALTSTNAAKLYNMFPAKGRIAQGSDADILVWDPLKQHTFSAATHFTKSEIEIYEGMTVKGSPVMTIVNGQIVFQDGKIVATGQVGTFVARKPFGAAYDA